MPTLFVFLFKVNIALLLFCAGYYLVLRPLTFYSLNRVYLLTAIIFATIYPKIDLTAFAQRHENIAIPVQTVLLNWQAPTAKLVAPLTRPDYWHWAALLFWAGAALLALRLFVQLFSLLKLYKNSKPANILEHNVRLIPGKAAPFSFWRNIYINPENHTPADLKAILLHEQVHVNGWHTVDILLAELSSIFYWFNPGVWLMKKAVRENIEFITDRKILNNGIDTKAYQYSLVNVSFNAATPGIVNHFNISTIKKRIIMMNTKRSSRFNLTRYAFVLPAVALLLVFSFSKAAIVRKGAKAYREISHTFGVNLTAALRPENKKTIHTESETVVFNAGGDDDVNIIYYINGIKGNSNGNQEFPDDTENIYYLTSADAKKYFKAGDGRHKVGFVNTKESAAGKSINDKIAGLIQEGKIKAGFLNHIAVSHNNVRMIKTSLLLQADTAHRTSLVISADNSKLLDSLNYVLNGKKISSADFKKIDPNTIASVNITSADQARLLLDDFDSYNFKKGSKILFVNTTDSEKGKKMEALFGTNNLITTVRINGKTSTLPGGFSPYQVDSMIVGKDGAGRIQVQSFKQLKTVKGSTLNPRQLDSLIILKDGEINGLTTIYALSENPAKLNGVKPMTYSVTSPANLLKLNKVRVTGFSGKNGEPAEIRTLTGNMFYTDGAVNRISDKLIVIDGREATEKDLKKLSAFDIDRMSTSSDADTVKKYGSKAKYGVVYIYTKKRKQ